MIQPKEPLEGARKLNEVIQVSFYALRRTKQHRKITSDFHLHFVIVYDRNLVDFSWQHKSRVVVTKNLVDLFFIVN